MNIRCISNISINSPLRNFNEDLIIVQDDLYIILDGATGIGENVLNIGNSDAEWFVKRFKNIFLKNWNIKPNFKKNIKDTIISIEEEYRLLTNNIKVEKFQYPSASLVAVVKEKNNVVAYNLGDCSLYSKHFNKKLFLTSPLNKLDEKSIQKMQMILRKGISYKIARDRLIPILKKNRLLMNVDKGYGILTINPSCIQYLESKILYNTDKLILCSDGFSAIEDKYKYYSVSELFYYATNKSLSFIINKIHKLEKSDLKFIRYPRTKVFDDVSAIFLEIN